MASLTAIGFHAAAAVALGGAALAVVARRPERSLAGFALALAALVVPLVQLEATLVAALAVLAAGISLALLGALVRLSASGDPGAGAGQGQGPGAGQGPGVAQGPGRGRWGRASFWLPASLGLAGFVWVLLATGSRQVVEPLPPLERKAVGYGAGERVVELLAGEHLVSATLVGLIALCCVIAAVLSLVGEGEAR